MRKRNHRITIRRLETSQDATNGIITETWPVFAVVWAEVVPLSAREFIAAGATQSKVTTRIEIDYLDGVLPSMRIDHGSRTYKIEGSLPDPKSGIEYLTLPCSEIVNG